MGHPATHRRRALTTGVVGACALLLLAPRGAALAYPRYADRMGLSCITCHVGSEGGELTERGRSLRFEAMRLDGGATGASGGASGGAAAADAPPALPPWGSLSGEASLYLNGGRQPTYAGNSMQYSVAESLRLAADRIGGHDELSFHGEGMARSTFSDGPVGPDGNAARLTTAELDWTPHDGSTSFRLGRHFVVAGVAARELDGLSLHTTPSDLLELDAFGGVPSDNGFGGASGDLFVGGRAGLVAGREFRGGISGYYAKDAADPSDLRLGLDLDYAPARQFELVGHLFYDWIGERIYDGRLHAIYKPSIAWQYAVDASYSVPGLFFPKDSIFSVFSVDAVKELGGTVTHLLDERRSVKLFAREDWYEQGDSATQLGTGFDLRYGPNGEDSVGSELYWQDEQRGSSGAQSVDGNALFLRLYHFLFWTATLYTAEEVDWNLYPGNHVAHDAGLLRLLVGYRPGACYDFQLGVEEVRDPETDSRTLFFAQATWRF